MLIYYSKKVKMLLPLNYKAPCTLSKGRCSLGTNIYLLSSIMLVFSIKIVGLSFKEVNWGVGRYTNKLQGELAIAMLNSEVDRAFFVKISDKRFNNKSFKARFLLSRLLMPFYSYYFLLLAILVVFFLFSSS